MNLIIIQARMGSSRLPKKTLMKIGDITLLEWVILRLKRVKNRKKIVIATTKNSEDLKIKKIAKKHFVDFFQGDEKNLLKRFFDVSKKYNVKNIVRICADNPFICPLEVDLLIKDFVSSKYKYSFNDRDYRNFKFADGFGAEIFNITLLRYLYDKVYAMNEKEHVTLHLWNKSKYLSPSLSNIPLKYRSISIDVNYKKDFEKISYYVKKFKLNYMSKTSEILRVFSKDNFFKK